MVTFPLYGLSKLDLLRRRVRRLKWSPMSRKVQKNHTCFALRPAHEP